MIPAAGIDGNGVDFVAMAVVEPAGRVEVIIEPAVNTRLRHKEVPDVQDAAVEVADLGGMCTKGGSNIVTMRAMSVMRRFMACFSLVFVGFSACVSAPLRYPCMHSKTSTGVGQPREVAGGLPTRHMRPGPRWATHSPTVRSGAVQRREVCARDSDPCCMRVFRLPAWSKSTMAREAQLLDFGPIQIGVEV